MGDFHTSSQRTEVISGNQDLKGDFCPLIRFNEHIRSGSVDTRRFHVKRSLSPEYVCFIVTFVLLSPLNVAVESAVR